MRVGVPSEIKPGEHRVGLTPTAVREYVGHGHTVIVQSGAGLGAGYADDVYVMAGASIVPDAAAVFAGADMIVIGSRGLGELKGLLVGSVSNKVAEHAKCSVLTVR